MGSDYGVSDFDSIELGSDTSTQDVIWERKQLCGHVLITGGNGALGRLFAEYLLNEYPE